MIEYLRKQPKLALKGTSRASPGTDKVPPEDLQSKSDAIV
jgi:hypothetical protein